MSVAASRGLTAFSPCCRYSSGLPGVVPYRLITTVPFYYRYPRTQTI